MTRTAKKAEMMKEMKDRAVSMKETKKAATKKSPEWKSLHNPEKLAYLLANPTIPDKVHTADERKPKEDRATFLNRIYG